MGNTAPPNKAEPRHPGTYRIMQVDSGILDFYCKGKKSLDAPIWLWSSVVALVANHEAASLEHCRKFAAAAA
jgi:hypothetical protein